MTNSQVRSISVIVMLLGGTGMPSPAQNPTSRPFFFGRELVPNQRKAQLLNDLNKMSTSGSSNEDLKTAQNALTSIKYDSKIKQKYDQIDPAKSLMINDCDGFCDDPFFGFQSAFTKALALSVAQPSKKEAGLEAWYQSAAGAIDSFRDQVRPWAGKQNPPFQLLAVVNRIDMARYHEHNWSGAELHLVYGLLRDGMPAPFMLIIEFTLPPLGWNDFRAMAEDWHGLRSSSEFASKLISTLRTKPWSPLAPNSMRGISARLRINFQVNNGDSPWALAQWEFLDQKLVPLPDQIRAECIKPELDSAEGRSTCKEFRELWSPKFWSRYNHRAEPYLQIVSSLSPQLLSYFNGSHDYGGTFEGMPAQPGKCGKDFYADEARNVIALQQCSFCHGAETNNLAFTHVHNRLPKTHKAELSKFLQPNDKNNKPSYDDVVAQKAGVMFTANVTVRLTGCATKTKYVPRMFNDLARRTLFLAAVLAPDSEPDYDLRSVILKYRQDFTH